MSHPRGDAGDILDGESALSKVCKRGVSDTFTPFSGGEKGYLSFPPPLTVDKSSPSARTVVIAPDFAAEQ
jgi:hypothetical protein